jgi:large subunit ribosomal protein L24
MGQFSKRKEMKTEARVSLKIRKGDKVRVLSGKDKGREGEVQKTLPRQGKIIVAGVNLMKHFTKKSSSQPGGIHEHEAPLWAAKVALICPKCKKPTRLSRQRICRHCGQKVS